MVRFPHYEISVSKGLALASQVLLVVAVAVVPRVVTGLGHALLRIKSI